MVKIPGILARVLPGFILRYAQRLKFPQLFLIMLCLFVLDFLIPDPIPFLDEIFFGVATLLLASLKNRGE